MSILIIGKTCSGKTTLLNSLKNENYLVFDDFELNSKTKHIIIDKIKSGNKVIIAISNLSCCLDFINYFKYIKISKTISRKDLINIYNNTSIKELFSFENFYVKLKILKKFEFFEIENF